MSTVGHAIDRHLRKLRLARGLGLSETGRRMGTTPHRIYAIETSGKDPTMTTVIRYCNAIGARVHIGLVDPTHTDPKET